jgi:hypothetical protein
MTRSTISQALLRRIERECGAPIKVALLTPEGEVEKETALWCSLRDSALWARAIYFPGKLTRPVDRYRVTFETRESVIYPIRDGLLSSGSELCLSPFRLEITE